MKYYQTGKSKAVEKAYPPLMLFKCLMLQKRFQIESDPELESRINISVDDPRLSKLYVDAVCKTCLFLLNLLFSFTGVDNIILPSETFSLLAINQIPAQLF